MTVVSLAGCRLEPLGSYLKALGVLRLVASQADPAARGWWAGDSFRLESDLDELALVEFFVDRYVPTPVVSPWNNDAGFKEGTSSSTERLLLMESTTDPRFGPYRKAIRACRDLRALPAWDSADKAAQVTMLRNVVGDDAAEWIDAAIVLRSEKPAFPALLGAGGNLGRLELSPTFMARLLDVLDPGSRLALQSRPWLEAALFERGAPKLRSDPVGQFDPGGAGGLRADARAAKPLTNPWDFVLIIEGAMVWTSGVARREGGAVTTAAVPFNVAPSTAGEGSLAAGESAKSELWAPIWCRPAPMSAIRRLFSEGRISWSKGQARSGVDAARALRTLGVDAGLQGFVRYLIADRMGQSPLAVPLGRLDVSNRTDGAVTVSAAVDPWIGRLRRAAAGKNAPASLVRSAAGVERALFTASRMGLARDVHVLLTTLGHAERTVGLTERARADAATPPPVPPLAAADWLPVVDDGSVEVRLAAALAVATDGDVIDARAGCLRTLLGPLAPIPTKGDPFGRMHWSLEEPPVSGLGARPVTEVLATALVARCEVARRVPDSGSDPAADRRLAAPWFRRGVLTRTGDLERLAAGDADEDRLGELLVGFLLLGPRPPYPHHVWERSTGQRLAPPIPPVPAWRLLAPFFSCYPMAGGVRLHPAPGWARRIVAGDLAGVLADALVRWRQAGLTPVYDRSRVDAIADATDPGRLATALLISAPPADLDNLLVQVVPDLDPNLAHVSDPNLEGVRP